MNYKIENKYRNIIKIIKIIYKIKINNRYESYDIVNAATLSYMENIILEPYKEKLFNHDVFSINENIIKVEHSTVRSTPNIPGVLVLDTKKVYGKIKNKFLYKLILTIKDYPNFWYLIIKK